MTEYWRLLFLLFVYDLIKITLKFIFYLIIDEDNNEDEIKDKNLFKKEYRIK